MGTGRAWDLLTGTGGRLLAPAARVRDVTGRPLPWRRLRDAGRWLTVARQRGAPSAERRAAAVLRETRQFYVAIDEDGRVLSWNRAAEKLFGFSAAQALGRSLDVLIVPPQHHESHRSGVEQFKRTGHGRGIDGPVEVDALRADGSAVPVELSIWADRTRRGWVFHALGHDLTERRRYEELLRLLAAHREGLLRSDHPEQARQLMCDTVLEVVGCQAVYLYEPRSVRSGPDGPDASDRELHLTAQAVAGAGPAPDRLELPADLEHALEPGHRLDGTFVGDLQAEVAPELAALRATGLGSVAVEAVHASARLLGVLVLGWTAPRPTSPDTDRRLLTLLSSEAGLVVERLSLQQQLQEAATTDALTGLLNRRAFDAALAREVQRARREGTPLSLALLDLDRFKAYNDTFGHPAGDALLSAVARTWSSQVRTVDALARLGGDEFALLMPGVDLAAAAHATDRVVQSTAAQVSVSIGAAQLQEEESTEALVQRADRELYAHKRRRGAELEGSPPAAPGEDPEGGRP